MNKNDAINLKIEKERKLYYPQKRKSLHWTPDLTSPRLGHDDREICDCGFILNDVSELFSQDGHILHSNGFLNFLIPSTFFDFIVSLKVHDLNYFLHRDLSSVKFKK